MPSPSPIKIKQAEEKSDGGKQRRREGTKAKTTPPLAPPPHGRAQSMADGSDGTGVSPESEAARGGEIWGTLEELLLACAVTRHGTASWDSVAMEVQTRSPLAVRPGLTPRSCRRRFRHLHRRFSTAGRGGEEEVEEEDPDASAAEGWVDELRRLRVAELRRDVERCDLSIGTLQSKVKRLREEREQSVSGDAKPDEVSGNDQLSGEEPGRSCRESNSTDLKPPKHPGHHGSIKDEEVANQELSGESAAASKESSDVRSSVSLCRRRRGEAGSADEEEEEEASPRRPPTQSPPLAALLDAVAAKLGSVLQRLHEHESKEGAAYRDTIRRHVDLEMVRGKLKTSAGSRGGDGDCCYPASEFYRDLLLLCTNAVVFFPRSGTEHAAAVEARALVSEHASAVLREPKQEHVAVPAPAGAGIVGSLIEKGKPLIVCRKRSSIAKAAAVRKEESAEKGEAEEESEDEKKAVAAVTKDKVWGLRTKKGAVKNLAAIKLAEDTAAAEGAKKADEKVGGAAAAAGGLAKKRNAVDFLKRLNQGSSPSKKRGSALAATRKRRASAVAAEQQNTRKRGAGRGGSKRGGKAGATKRSVGRPLKRGPAPTTPPPPSKRAKTNRSEKPSTMTKRGGRGGGR